VEAVLKNRFFFLNLLTYFPYYDFNILAQCSTNTIQHNYQNKLILKVGD